MKTIMTSGMQQTVCVPFNVTDIDFALLTYYTKSFISNAEIAKLFGLSRKSTATINRLKKMVLESDSDKPLVYGYGIRTKVAYDVWGIDVKELELAKKKLEKLGLKEKGV